MEGRGGGRYREVACLSIVARDDCFKVVMFGIEAGGGRVVSGRCGRDWITVRRHSMQNIKILPPPFLPTLYKFSFLSFLHFAHAKYQRIIFPYLRLIFTILLAFFPEL